MKADSRVAESQLAEKRDELATFLNTLEHDLLQLRTQIESLKKPRRRGRRGGGRRARIAVNRSINFASLRAELSSVREALLNGHQTDPMIGPRRRAEISHHVSLIEEWRNTRETSDERITLTFSGSLHTATEAYLHSAASPDGESASVRRIKRTALRMEKDIILGELLDKVEAANREYIDKLFASGELPDAEIAAIKQFYVYYAVFTEYFNAVKLLYQVLLKEYEELDILDDQAVTGLRVRAILKISARLLRNEWRGAANADYREEFRHQMMALIRTEMHAATNSDATSEVASALCLSGGGIRSATFSLGVIQSLAQNGLLDKFTYLSTVSGGGFIGSWLTAWIHRTREGTTGVQKKLAAASLGAVEPDEVSYLRTYSNYMSPRVGAGSADTWTLVAVYVRNLLLNWTVFFPLFAAALILPRIVHEYINNGETMTVGPDTSLAGGMFVNIAAIAGIIAIFAMTIFRPSSSDFVENIRYFRQQYIKDDVGVVKTVEGRVLLWTVLPLVIYALVMSTYWFWVSTGDRRTALIESTGTFMSDYGDRISWLLTIAFVVAAVLNHFARRKQRSPGILDPIFEVVMFAACIAVTWLVSQANPGGRLFTMIVFYEVVFFVGFALAIVVAKWYGKAGTVRTPFTNAGIEFAISFLATAAAGSFLYVADKLFTTLFIISSVGGAGRFGASALYAIFSVPAFLLAFLLGATVFVGIGSKIHDDLDREWLARLGGYILLVILGWILVFGLVLIGPSLVRETVPAVKGIIASAGGVAGAITLLFGYYGRNSSSVPSGEKTKKSRLASLAPKIAAPIFAAFLLLLVVIATDLLIDSAGEKFPTVAATGMNQSGFELLVLFGWFVAFASVGLLAGWWVNVNQFSLHGTYRDRLIRAYLGASRGERRMATANSFTGFDKQDDISLYKLFHKKPFHVVNMTLNLAKTQNLQWQLRKAESFTATPFHCGSSNMGKGSGCYRSSKLYGATKSGEPITLGTSAAISGAAATPSMGYFTQSAPVSALMALFNVRLGWWLGNPGTKGEATYQKNAPELSPLPLVSEALGLTSDTSRYVYLSDGGHFDNLGLYEMVLRRCKLIVLCDAGADSEFGFSDLGNAIHKIRVDMGISIEFDSGDMPVVGRNCSVATIRYTAADGKNASDGMLIYLKPTLDGNQSIDVVNYKKRFAQFPHESTADQMFSETQFESYRLLGYHMMQSICCLPKPKGQVRTPLRILLEKSLHYLRNHAGAAAVNAAPPWQQS